MKVGLQQLCEAVTLVLPLMFVHASLLILFE